MEWISIKETLPGEGEWVLCVDKYGRMFTAEHTTQSCYYAPYSLDEPGYRSAWDSWHCCGSEPGEPTHWMRLPAQPPL